MANENPNLNDAATGEITEYITKEQREIVAAAARRLGVVEAAKRLGISSEAMLRVCGDFGSQPGTEALVVQRLGRLEG